MHRKGYTLTSSPTTLEIQTSLVIQFAKDNFLNLNALKCEIIAFEKSFTKGQDDEVIVDGNSFPVKKKAKCLGYLYKQNLSSLPMIEDRIQKARKAFFQFGSVYAFQGN